MKKILSLILCGLFLNLMFCPAVLADVDVQAANGEQVEANSDVVTQDSTQSTADVQTEVPAQTQEDTVVTQQNTEKTEHITINKKNSKNVSVESVYISSHDVIIPAKDILQVAFVNDFNGRKAHVGDTVEFRFPSDVVTQEGTVIIPSTARVVAEITNLKKPKPLHMSGKVYLTFKYIQFADGTQKPINAKVYGKKEFLSRRALNSTMAVGETATTVGAGTTAGALMGLTSSHILFIIFGTAVGAAFGAAAGLAVGIILPGAAFKAKAGQTVDIELTQELDI